MALKDDLQSIKNNLSAQEKMIENFIKGERFFKKYKYIIIAVLVLLIAYFIYISVDSSLNENRIKENNELLISLMKEQNSTKEELLKEKNPNLYAIYLLNRNDMSFDELSKELQDLKLDPLVKELLSGSNSNLLGDYNKLLQAYDLLKQDKIEEARVILDKIPNLSEIKQLADNFKHYHGKQ